MTSPRPHMQAPLLSESSRVLIVAPHPDDESLAAAGLVLRARRVGAALRILFLTDGDNNPWPQRASERHWTVDDAGRRRWGARRRGEAIAALRTLGLGPDCARFLEYPDQGLTDELTHGHQLNSDLVDELETWRPNLVIAPAIADRHPDHNSLGLALDFALREHDDKSLTRLSYLLHGNLPPLPSNDLIQLDLNEDDLKVKQRAVLCHQTQMILSRRRFLNMAGTREIFFRETGGNSESTAVAVSATQNGLRIVANPLALFEASVSMLSGPQTAATAKLASSPLNGRVGFKTFQTRAAFDVPLPGVMTLASSVWVKLRVPWRFLDVTGWRKVRIAPSPIRALPTEFDTSPTEIDGPFSITR